VRDETQILTPKFPAFLHLCWAFNFIMKSLQFIMPIGVQGVLTTDGWQNKPCIHSK